MGSGGVGEGRIQKRPEEAELPGRATWAASAATTYQATRRGGRRVHIRRQFEPLYPAASMLVCTDGAACPAPRAILREP